MQMARTYPLQDPINIPPPDDTTWPIAYLKKTDGFACSACNESSRYKHDIRAHWREAGHDGKIQDCWKPVTLQTWMGGPNTRFWVIQGSDVTIPTIADGPVLSAAQRIQRIHEELEVNARNDANLQEGLDHNSSWVKEMQWVKFVGERDPTEVHKAAQWLDGTREGGGKGKREETAESEMLRKLYRALDREVSRCTKRLAATPAETLQRLHGIEKGKLANSPFTLPPSEGTVEKYKTSGYRYLTFCWRGYVLGRTSGEEKLGITFTDEQWHRMQAIASALGYEADGNTADDGFSSQPSIFSSVLCSQASISGMCDDEDETMVVDSNNATGDIISNEEEVDNRGKAGVSPEENHMSSSMSGNTDESALDEAIFSFMLASIKTRVPGRIFSNALLSFCGAAGIRVEPLGFAQPVLFTSILAALQWLCRLFFLEGEFADVELDVDSVDLDALDSFDAAHEKWMCIGCNTVMSKITRWMAYGKGCRKSMMGTASVRWEDNKETLVHNGDRISMRKFKLAAREAMERADTLVDELLGEQWRQLSSLVDLSRIEDHPIMIGAGESFATNAKNAWLKPGPGQVLESAAGLLLDTAGNIRLAGVKKWLQTLRKCRTALMTMLAIWGGQAGRGVETMTLRHCDTWQLMRNIIVHNKTVMIVTDRDKMKEIRSQGRKTARFLPANGSRMIIAYIAWLMPAERALCKLAELGGPPARAYVAIRVHVATRNV